MPRLPGRVDADPVPGGYVPKPPVPDAHLYVDIYITRLAEIAEEGMDTWVSAGNPSVDRVLGLPEIFQGYGGKHLEAVSGLGFSA